MSNRVVIAVDGPSGVGKTSVSRAVAERLGFGHLDTGAYYRGATMAAMINRVDLADEQAVAAAVEKAAFDFADGVMTLEGIDVSAAIRTDVITAGVSVVAAHPAVRAVLVGHQRRWVADHDCNAVVEGRDIGTVVFADSPLKVFLTARPEVRAARRARQDGEVLTEAVRTDLDRRDRIDSTRQASPLVAAADAVEIDTSDLALNEVIEVVMGLAGERGLTADRSMIE
jgi:cytidylate kinase